MLLVVVAVAAAGFAGWWYFIRDDAPPKAALVTRDPADTAAAAGPTTAEGAWKVEAGDAEQVFVGYRMQELFGGETIKKTAAGRTGDVSGTMTVTGTSITAASIEANLTSLASDRTARDTAIKDRGLETTKFPDATFTLTDPIALGVAPARGKVVKVTAKGTLTLHGVDKAVAVAIEARWNGTTIDVSGSAPVVLADYGIDQIDTPIVKIDDHGELEFQLTFVPA